MEKLKNGAEWLTGSFGGFLAGISLAVVQDDRILGISLLIVGLLLIMFGGLVVPRIIHNSK